MAARGCAVGVSEDSLCAATAARGVGVGVVAGAGDGRVSKNPALRGAFQLMTQFMTQMHQAVRCVDVKMEKTDETVRLVAASMRDQNERLQGLEVRLGAVEGKVTQSRRTPSAKKRRRSGAGEGACAGGSCSHACVQTQLSGVAAVPAPGGRRSATALLDWSRVPKTPGGPPVRIDPDPQPDPDPEPPQLPRSSSTFLVGPPASAARANSDADVSTSTSSTTTSSTSTSSSTSETRNCPTYCCAKRPPLPGLTQAPTRVDSDLVVDLSKVVKQELEEEVKTNSKFSVSVSSTSAKDLESDGCKIGEIRDADSKLNESHSQTTFGVDLLTEKTRNGSKRSSSCPFSALGLKKKTIVIQLTKNTMECTSSRSSTTGDTFTSPQSSTPFLSAPPPTPVFRTSCLYRSTSCNGGTPMNVLDTRCNYRRRASTEGPQKKKVCASSFCSSSEIHPSTLCKALSQIIGPMRCSPSCCVGLRCEHRRKKARANVIRYASSSTFSSLSSLSSMSLMGTGRRRASPPSPPRAASVREELGMCLLKAAQSGRDKELLRLLAQGADVNFCNASRWSALHRAVKNAHPCTAALLLRHGADPNAVTAYGFTALHVAAYKDSSGRCASVLVNAGAAVDLWNRFGQTPLHYACESGNEATARVLLASGASKYIRNNDGKTPYDVAKSNALRRALRANGRARRRRRTSRQTFRRRNAKRGHLSRRRYSSRSR